MPPRGTEDELNEESHLLIKTSPRKISDDEISTWSRISAEIKVQMSTALPTVQSMVLTKIPWLISIRFVGGLGSQELAAAALATTLCNVTGLSFSVGLSAALTTLAGQAKGELCSRPKRQGLESLISTTAQQQPLTPLVFLFRGLIIQLSLVIPIGIWWLLGTESFLLSLGQQKEVASMTDAYLRILTPGLWFYSISWTLTAWVQSIGMADVPAYAAVLGLVLHIPFNLFFINYLGMGYLGCAVATVCFQAIQVRRNVFRLVICVFEKSDRKLSCMQAYFHYCLSVRNQKRTATCIVIVWRSLNRPNCTFMEGGDVFGNFIVPGLLTVSRACIARNSGHFRMVRKELLQGILHISAGQF